MTMMVGRQGAREDREWRARDAGRVRRSGRLHCPLKYTQYKGKCFLSISIILPAKQANLATFGSLSPQACMMSESSDVIIGFPDLAMFIAPEEVGTLTMREA